MAQAVGVSGKLVGIGGGKKSEEPRSCMYCGALPACPDMTCPRVKYFELMDDGVTLGAVEFFENWRPPTPPRAA